MTAIRGVIFDLDNTLIDRDRALAACLATQVGTRDLAGLLTIDAGGMGDREEFFTALARAVGRPPLEARHRLYQELPRHVTLKPDAAELLARLAGRYALAVGSNGSTDLQMRKLRAAGLDDGRFAVIAISQQVGVDKPDPRFFTGILERLALAPAQVLMIGDHPHNDIAGAQAVGLRTCWVRTPQREPPAFADQAVDRLTDVVLP